MKPEVPGEQQNEKLVFSKEQMEYLRNLLSNHQTNNLVIGTGPTFYSGKFTDTPSNLQNSTNA